MPSHLTQEEHVTRGRPAGWHVGDCNADEAAKAAARRADLPAALLASHRHNREVAARVASTIAAIQLKRLKGRPRTAMGSAAKERTRRVPGLPRRLRVGGVKRARLSAAAAAPPAQEAAVEAASFLQLKAAAWPADELVQA